jgi:Tetratricopeptide repeat.
MKFVFNEEKNEEQRKLLMMVPSIDEAQALLDKDETDPYGWYVMGTALSLKEKYEEAIDAYSMGIMYAPFYAPNYFGRGRRHNAIGEWKQAMADFTVAIKLDPQNWTYWYYRATTANVRGGLLEDSIDDFKECLKLTKESEHYPLVHWLYTTYAELGNYKKAEDSLSLIDASVKAPQMDYGYERAVKLYKGLVKPEEYIDEEKMAKVVIDRPNRVHFEESHMLYGLYWYWMIHGDEAKAKEAIERLQVIGYPQTFGLLKSKKLALKYGIKLNESLCD